MKSNPEYYQLLARVISYPSDYFWYDLDMLSTQTKVHHPELNDLFDEFFIKVTKLDKYSLEEFYINTFLLQPISSLDIGFVLFGNDARRNEILVNISAEQSKAKNNCGIELADHFPNILTLIPKIEDDEFRNEFVYSLVLPATGEIYRRFIETGNFYKHIIELALRVLEKDFQGFEYEQIEINKNIKF